MFDLQIWLFIWLGLIYLPRILMIRMRWSNEIKFLAARPDKEWLISGYKLFTIVWLPLSTIITARNLQNSPENLFYVYVISVPLIGLGFFKGIAELLFEISWFYSWRFPDSWLNKSGTWPRGSYYWKFFQYYFAHSHSHIRVAGGFRLVLNTAVLITLLIFF